MAPSKTTKISSNASSSRPSTTSTKNDSKHKRPVKGHKPSLHNDPQPSVSGVQKIKSLLRQTRRLLAKDKLAADVRQATERKMRALEMELVDAERARKERTMATRYHKIKFFERQKVVRKIQQVKKKLEACTEKSEKKALKKTLLDLRVDLNYIQHYPKTMKYISLFPPEARGEASSDAKGKSKDVGSDLETQTDAQRETLRKQIREMMERSELNSEPETETGAERSNNALNPHTAEGNSESNEFETSKKPNVPSKMDADAFFGDDSDENADSAEEDMDDS
ncbi:hypothetical protein EUX98_g5146 [Antrodiella citrinella]|uniref:rRNA-processing protein EFG1 n=1 Tax=Antrodiella citrinella TaxID=2447956 RepID=A0A4S4MS87_9APHY|nr:hypothetical protein EUX98_g5146 [Antrodiella citrinella]